jgi:hypothetical protein
MTAKRRKYIGILTAAVLLALAAVYFLFDPNTEGVFPKCAFYVLTGWKCPGCGSQRALHALLHGDIAGAFHMNMWIPVAAIYIVLVTIALFFSNRNSRYSKIVTNDYLFATFLLFTIAWFVLRNVYGV